ncbi:MAG: acetyl-CoA C-acyltransferase [Euryarchaeota archaeon]|nr:acetyl-CoA C-acyltransferase [Euryarchaeota archaeon]
MVRAVIVDWKRSPFTRAHKGALSKVRPDDLAAQVIMALMDGSGIDSLEIDDLIVGCAYPEGEQGYNIGRILSFIGGLGEDIPGQTINRLCGSSMQAILTAASNIASGWGNCFLCGGVESMSRVKRRGFNWSPNKSLMDQYPQAYVNMGITAENVAEKFTITREEQETFALQSHHKAARASSKGNLSQELVPIISEGSEVLIDGCIRADTSIESMAKLSPAFIEDGTVTAATSSPLTDGAVFSIVCSEEFAERNSLSPIAAIVSGSVTGCPPDLMGLGPISSTNVALERAGWDVSDVDVIELNEAFSSQSIACINELGLDPNKVNIDGGSLALGHPLGASGARIVCKAATIMKRTESNRALATMCIGGGMGISLTLEAV